MENNTVVTNTEADKESLIKSLKTISKAFLGICKEIDKVGLPEGVRENINEIIKKMKQRAILNGLDSSFASALPVSGEKVYRWVKITAGVFPDDLEEKIIRNHFTKQLIVLGELHDNYLTDHNGNETSYFYLEFLEEVSLPVKDDESIKSVEKLLPDNEELVKLKNSIWAADPSGYDIMIKDIKKQVDSVVRKVQAAIMKLNTLIN